MGTSATTSQVDEDNLLVSSLGTGSGNAIRVNAGATGDTPSPISTTFNSSATPAVYEAIVRGGTCLLYTSPSPRDKRHSRMPSSA